MIVDIAVNALVAAAIFAGIVYAFRESPLEK